MVTIVIFTGLAPRNCIQHSAVSTQPLEEQGEQMMALFG